MEIKIANGFVENGFGWHASDKARNESDDQ
jgi:hypothetical protein